MAKAINKKPKRKMQNVSFSSIEEFLEFLPAEELRITEYLRKIIFSCLPNCTEKLSYNVPFYKVHSNICFIWPPSVTWGGMQQQGVRFGFTNGHLLHDETGYLDKGERKQVYWRDFSSIKEIDADLLKSFIYDAAIIDQQKAAEKIKKKRK